MQAPRDKSLNDTKILFWKKNSANLPVPGSIQRVYGAMHPPFIDSKPTTPKHEMNRSKHKRTSSSSSFQDFQESTEDAWDLGDDDFCQVSSTDVKISQRVALSTALTVLNNHSELSKSAPSLQHPNLHRNCSLDDGDARQSRDLRLQRATANRIAANRESSPTTGSRIISYSQGGGGGPGLGIRQSSRPSMPRASPDRYYRPPNLVAISDREAARIQKFHSLLEASNVDIDGLRELSWSGIPPTLRPITWRLLSGYIPSNIERRDATMKRKREEYFNFVKKYYDTREEDIYQETYRQIHIDIPRMSPLVPLFQQEIVQQIFERILYIWAIRHPASGYVQGMNDLVTPFFVVFLHELVVPGTNVESYDVSQVDQERLSLIEADSFWCMSKLLDGIQDNYTFAQPGIQRQVKMLKDLVSRIDESLHEHLQIHTVEYLQFSFRWMNNLLMRELPLHCTIRLWDTYLSENEGFSSFHLYVCAAFLTFWSKELLRERDFQGLMLMLQNLPTLHWTDEEISILLADAYRLKFTFADAPNHLQPIPK